MATATPVPQCNRDAEALLRRAKVISPRVIRVEPDAVMFVDSDGDAWTAWLELGANQEAKVADIVKGFEAWRA